MGKLKIRFKPQYSVMRYISGMGLGVKLVLAALSGFLVALFWSVLVEIDNSVYAALAHGLLGSLFTAGVLLPYLWREDLRSWRPVGLVVISAASFYCAVYAAEAWSSGMWGPNLEDFVIASIVGAGIVLLPSPYILTLRYSLKYLVLGVLTAVIGGVLFSVSFGEFAYALYLNFASWHMVMCVALHFSNPSAAEDRWLANVKRSKVFVAVGFFALLAIAPVVDDGIGTLVQDRYARNDEGLAARDGISAYGVRDERTKSISSPSCSYGCIHLVRDDVLAFQEYVIDDARGAYQLFFVGNRPDHNCHSYGKDWNSPVEAEWYRGGVKFGEDRCLTYRIVDEPIAKYAIREHIGDIDAGFGLYPLLKTLKQVVRLSDNTPVAEASYYVYYSRFDGRAIGTVESWAELLQRSLPLASGEWQPPPP